MEFEKSTLTQVSSQSSGVPEQGDKLLACCMNTIAVHSAHNPMMVCPECKQIVKCFDNERAFSNYVKFCESRHRKVFTARHEKFFVVVFRSYDTFAS